MTAVIFNGDITLEILDADSRCRKYGKSLDLSIVSALFRTCSYAIPGFIISAAI
jgi:hypothetical protein